MAWSYDIQGLEPSLTDDSVEVGIDHDEARACTFTKPSGKTRRIEKGRTPVAEETRLDIVGRYVALNKHIVIQKYHCCGRVQ